MGSCACTLILHRLDININIRLACFDYNMAFDLAWFIDHACFRGPMWQIPSAINCFQLYIWVYMQVLDGHLISI